MSEDKGIINDPELYLRMSEPHASREADEEAYDKFFDDVRAARERHRIREVVIVSLTTHESPDGVRAMFRAGNMGSSAHVEKMLATALGLEREQRDRELDELAGKKKRHRAAK